MWLAIEYVCLNVCLCVYMSLMLTMYILHTFWLPVGLIMENICTQTIESNQNNIECMHIILYATWEGKDCRILEYNEYSCIYEKRLASQNWEFILKQFCLYFVYCYFRLLCVQIYQVHLETN